MEIEAHYQKGTRVGARSTRTVIIQVPADDLAAIRLEARAAFKRDFPAEHAQGGYRLVSYWSDETGLQHV